MWNVCQNCGRSMSWQKQKWCSDACKMQAYRRRKDSLVGSIERNAQRIKKSVETKQNTLKEVTCRICSKVFTIEQAKTNTIYCSNACSQKAYRQRRKSETTTSAPTLDQTEQTPAQAVHDPASAAAGIHGPNYFQFQIRDEARVINLKSDRLNQVGWVRGVEGDQVEILFNGYDTPEKVTFKASELAITDWACDAGPRGIQSMIDRISIEYRRRYGHSWMLEGGKVEARRDGHWVTVDDQAHYLNSRQHAKAFLANFYSRGVGDWTMVQQGAPKPNDM